MKVLVLSPVFSPAVGGSGVVFFNLAQCRPSEIVVLSQARDAITGKELDGWRSHDALQPFRVIRLPWFKPPTPPQRLGLLRRLCRLLQTHLLLRVSISVRLVRVIREVRPDVVCLGALSACYWMFDLLHYVLRRKVVLYLHGEEVNCDRLPGDYLNTHVRALRDADAVICVSNFTRVAVQRKTAPSGQLAVIHNGVDAARFTPGPKDEALLSRLQAHGKKLILTLARLDLRKGQDKVIEALPGILRAVPDCIYAIAGSGKEAGYLKALAADVGVAEYVRFTGAVPEEDLVRYYRACDLYVMSNRTMPDGDTEGFGLAFLEASACGKPVVGGLAGGVPDAVLDGTTGLLVDGNCPERIAEACIRILTSPELAERMGIAGRKHAEALSWRESANAFMKVCAGVPR